MNNQSQTKEIIMTKTRKETREERMNPSLDSPWNKMAVPTTDIFLELFEELREKEQQEIQKEKEKQNGISTKTF